MKTELLLRNCELATFYGKIVVTSVILLFFIGVLYIYFSEEDELIKTGKIIKGIIIMMGTTFCLHILFDIWIPC